MSAASDHLPQDLFDRARAVFPGGFVRATLVSPDRPLFAARGEGPYIYDLDDNPYLDLANNFTTLIHGHAPAEVVEAIVEQAALGTCYSMPGRWEVELAEELCRRSASFEKVSFTCSGSEAVMFAMRAARAITGRPKIAKCEGSYHGLTDFAEVSNDPTPATWGDRDPASVPGSRGVPMAVTDNVVVLPFNDRETSLNVLKRHRAELAAVVVDPLPSRAGLVPAHETFLEDLRRFCTDSGTLLIFDQVMSYRLAFGGVETAFGARPDLSALGKIIGGGLPVGAVAGPAEIMRVFGSSEDGAPHVFIGGTFAANPLSMAAGLAAMRKLDAGSIECLNAAGEHVRHEIQRHIVSRGLCACVTGAGSLLKIHPGVRNVTDYRSAWPDRRRRSLIHQLAVGLRERGVHIVPTGLISLSTCMSHDHLETATAATCATLDAICGP